MRKYVLTLALVLALPSFTHASSIGVGLDWRQKVFVQEYWQDGKAHYAIYNGRPEAIKVAVSDVHYTNVAGAESLREVEGKELGKWEVGGKSVVFVDAPMTAAGDGLRNLVFRIVDGPRLGLLSSPVAPAELPKDKIVSGDGLNGSGGRQPKVCYEQDSLTFKSEGIIEVQLKLPADTGTVTFKKGKSTDNIPVEAVISEAESATLPIQTDKEKIVVDTSKPLKAAEIHTVTLRFRAPKVDAATMVVIDGWVSLPSTVPGLPGGGFHVIRGVVVQPGK